MKAAEWIDRAKAARKWHSDYKCAQELGISRRTISNYRSADNAPSMDEETCVKVAAALRVRPELVILDQLAERTRSDLARQAIGEALERMEQGEPARARRSLQQADQRQEHQQRQAGRELEQQEPKRGAHRARGSSLGHLHAA